MALRSVETDRTSMESTPLTVGFTPSSFGGTFARKNSNVSNIDNDSSSYNGSDSGDDDDEEDHRTTTFQTFVHLFKGYLGAGCLSLPWAVSQLGMFWGPLAIVGVSIWSSYNCWTVVQLRRYIETKTPYNNITNNNNNNIIINNNVISSKASDKGSESSFGGASSSVATSQMTYPDVGDWAYGASFHTYVKVSLCTQQLAICTVFISFVGENLLAVLEYYGLTASNYEEERIDSTLAFLTTHTGVMTVIMPAIIALSLIPNLKLLSPVMAAGTFFLGICFVAIGVIVCQEWEHRPESPPSINLPQVPLATCAILYSYEGINLILPVESAMKDPQQFPKAFCGAMTCVAITLASMAIVCVLTFGYVDSGSVTAFLLDAYKDDETIVGWLMVANTAVSISVLVTYPLQLFPAIELLAPSISRFLPCSSGVGTTCKVCNNIDDDNDDDNDDDDLSAFEPLPPLPEHERADWGDEDLEFHQYEPDVDDAAALESTADDKSNNNFDDSGSIRSALTSVQSIFPKMTMPGDSVGVRLFLVVMTYLVAVAVPNVQALISLAGAVAGSSSALLIPPFLELAWIQHLEAETAPSTTGEKTTTNVGGGTGFSKLRSMISSRSGHLLNRIKCYVLLALGFLFFAIGTYASLADIIRIYVGEE